MENKEVSQIDTDQERDVEIVKESFKNWWKLLVILTPILASIIALSYMFFTMGGPDILKSIFGKQPTIIQTGVKK